MPPRLAAKPRTIPADPSDAFTWPRSFGRVAQAIGMLLLVDLGVLDLDAVACEMVALPLAFEHHGFAHGELLRQLASMDDRDVRTVERDREVITGAYLLEVVLHHALHAKAARAEAGLF